MDMEPCMGIDREREEKRKEKKIREKFMDGWKK